MRVSVESAQGTMSDMKALLLVGGLGTRLRSVVSSKPKVLASIGNESFLELLVRHLRSQGVRQLVMCTGYLADQVEHEFGDGNRWNVTIEYSKEEIPLGTAGAVKLAWHYVDDCPEFLVLNGDSFLEINYEDLVGFHRRRHQAAATIAVIRVQDASRYGTVRIDSDSRITGFAEKTGDNSPGLINGGVYVFNRAVREFIPEGPASLERDVFPRLLDQGVYAYEQRGMFIDIGTPSDYLRAQELLRSV
jgi:D-glycero-alpha-D-manno-heptose 1-phosphate guanylyltransferase